MTSSHMVGIRGPPHFPGSRMNVGPEVPAGGPSRPRGGVARGSPPAEPAPMCPQGRHRMLGGPGCSLRFPPRTGTLPPGG